MQDNNPTQCATEAELSRFFSAIRIGRQENVIEAIEQGMDVNQPNEGGSTALMQATYGGDPLMVALLISRGANVNMIDGAGESALHLARGHREDYPQIETLSLLLDAGAKLEVVNHEGDTPLLTFAKAARNYAIIKADSYIEVDHSPFIELLIERGANLLAVDRNGKTARDLIAGDLENCHPEKGRVMVAAIDRKLLEQQTQINPIQKRKDRRI